MERDIERDTLEGKRKRAREREKKINHQVCARKERNSEI